MKTFNTIAWTVNVVLVVVLASCWITGRVLAQFNYEENACGPYADTLEIVPNGTVPTITFDTTEPNLIWTAADLENVLSTVCVTGDYTIASDSGCNIVIKTESEPWEIIGDPNCYADAIKTMLICIIQQHESEAE